MPHIEIAAEKLFTLFGVPITNSLITSWAVVFVLLFAGFALSRRIGLVPQGIQNVVEITLEGFLGLMEGVLGSRQKAEKYLPIIGTLFFFILISNWLGIFPGVGSVGFFESAGAHGEEAKFVPLFRSAASDVNVTLALATVAVAMINISGAQALGIGAHLKRYFTFKGPIDFFVGILEFISEFAKIISFSFRLFGNVFAGEVLLTITGFLAPYGAPVPFLILEIFVGFIQALVFAMLSMVFISIAVSHH